MGSSPTSGTYPPPPQAQAPHVPAPGTFATYVSSYTSLTMSKRSVERKLRKTGMRLRGLRDELAVIDEQLAHLVDDTEDASLRALVAENPAAAIEHREATGHSEAMADHRRHVIAEIASLETNQDKLLDQLRLL